MAARQWAHGIALRSALERAGYRAERSAALHLGGASSQWRQLLARSLCGPLTDPDFVDFGAAEFGRDSWIIVAAPFTVPAVADSERVDAELLRLINAARGLSRRCGTRLYAAVTPLAPSAALRAAALMHAQDMLHHDFFEHTGADGSTPAQRVAANGYQYRIVGENIASGPETAAEAVAGWLASPSHCENIMDARFRDTGFAFAASSRGSPRIYWVEDFASPR